VFGTIDYCGYCQAGQRLNVSNGQERGSGSRNIGAKEKSRVAHDTIGSWRLERSVWTGPSGQNSRLLGAKLPNQDLFERRIQRPNLQRYVANLTLYDKLFL